ncbi:MAG: hypothetical protein IPJ13_08405 [Saprospiraceae bacterium]|nr:hypothetical protein [Saprospiraceae bacterium]
MNGNLKWCGDYDNFPVNAPGEDIFGENYLYFKVLSKKANNDTLMTIDRNRKVRYYNIRSGPCYDAIRMKMDIKTAIGIGEAGITGILQLFNIKL